MRPTSGREPRERGLTVPVPSGEPPERTSPSDRNGRKEKRMGKRWFLAACFVFLALGAAGSAFAQSAGDSINVTAVNNGIFVFNIAGASFDFGTVDADGTVSSTGVPGARNGSDTGSVYSATAATTWTCRSAPQRSVRILNASTTATVNWGTADRLSMQIPAAGLPGGSVSCGYKTFTTTGDGGAGGCAAGNLVHSVPTGNGANARTGNLDLRLDVLDTDATGANTWTVVLTASGA